MNSSDFAPLPRAVVKFASAFILLSSALLPPAAHAAFPDARDAPIAGWSGPVFRMSQDYPQTLPPMGNLPWRTLDFKTQPDDYIRAVLDYVVEGNPEVDWEVQRNAVRKWYHTPWMHRGSSGREFIHGLTRERNSPRPTSAGRGELHQNQTRCHQNWAVGFYNPRGGFVVGQVWANENAPDATKAVFPEGTVVAKLLFTQAATTEVPFLRNTFEWDAHINRPSTGTGCPGTGTRQVQKLRLLQLDVAVRDSRADPTTGWIFGTFVYDGNRSGATVWQRMVPVGLMWGNDPALTDARVRAGDKPLESWINPNNQVSRHLGRGGRLNGPVDNPRSACLSCHATAQTPELSSMLPSAADPMRWFRNIKAAQPFDAGARSLDYSLQLAMGIQNFRAANGPPGAAAPRPADPRQIIIDGKREFRIDRGD